MSGGALAALALACNSHATITPADELAVTGGGGGITVIDPATLLAEVGQPVDDTFSGTIACSFTLEFTQLANDTGFEGFAGLQFWQGGAERFGIGDNWASTDWSVFQAPVGNQPLLDATDQAVPLALNDPKTFTVTIDFVAGGDDTITVHFDGRDNVFTGQLDFDQVRVRCGNANQAATFTGMSLDFVFVDSDGDGLPDDPFEQSIIDASGGTLTLADIHGPLDATITSDYDADGLLDADEYAAGSDPVLADTDADGLDDGPEVTTHFTSPIDPDSDDDMLSDGDEVTVHSSDPGAFDSDGDGFADGLEVASGSLPDDIGNVPAVLTPFDQEGVGNGGDGITVIDPFSMSAHTGVFFVDDNITGTLTYSGTIEMTELDGTGGFTGLQLFNGNDEQLAVGNNSPSGNWGGFFGPGEFDLLAAGDLTVPQVVGEPKDFSVTIEYHRFADDVATIRFDGRDNVFTGDYSFDRLRVRSGNGSTASFRNLSLQFEIAADADADGLPDSWEQQIIDHAAAQDPPVVLALEDIKGPFEFPATSDYDQDGLEDDLEFDQSANPLVADSDGDGLDDGPEYYTYATLVADADSDDDQLSDGDEVNVYSSDPNYHESDDDGFADGLEVASGSDPNDIDDVPAVLTPLDRAGVTGGGEGIQLIDPGSLEALVGQPVDDTFSGTITYAFDIQFTELANGTGAEGYAALQLWQGAAERLGVGDHWWGTDWGAFWQGGDENAFTLLDSGDAPVPLAVGQPESFVVTIDFVAGGEDSVTIRFRGKDNVFSRNLDFNQLRCRAGNGNQVADFSNISFAVATGPADPFADWALAAGLDGSPGRENGRTDDPDGDGDDNFREFAFNGDPLSAASRGLAAAVVQDVAGAAGDELTLVVAVRDGAVFAATGSSPGLTQVATVDGIAYAIEGALDLAFPGADASSVGAPSDTAPAATGLPDLTGTAWEYHTFRLDASEGLPDRGFLRASAAAP